MTRIDNYIDLIGFLNELNCGEFEIEFVDMLKNKAAKKGLNLDKKNFFCYNFARMR